MENYQIKTRVSQSSFFQKIKISKGAAYMNKDKNNLEKIIYEYRTKSEFSMKSNRIPLMILTFFLVFIPCLILYIIPEGETILFLGLVLSHAPLSFVIFFPLILSALVGISYPAIKIKGDKIIIRHKKYNLASVTRRTSTENDVTTNYLSVTNKEGKIKEIVILKETAYVDDLMTFIDMYRSGQI